VKTTDRVGRVRRTTAATGPYHLAGRSWNDTDVSSGAGLEQAWREHFGGSIKVTVWNETCRRLTL
jgi:hypothetical protein